MPPLNLRQFLPKYPSCMYTSSALAVMIIMIVHLFLTHSIQYMVCGVVVSTVMKRIITGFPEEDVLLIGDRSSNEIVSIVGSIFSFT